MERGYIKINIEEDKMPLVEVQLVNNDLWLSKYEIARLLNCFPQKIEANLLSIFKNNLLWKQDVSYTYRYTDKDIEKQIVYYNLEVLIFLSYRIASFEAQIFRQFVNSTLRERLQKKTTPQANVKFIWLFQPQMNYC